MYQPYSYRRESDPAWLPPVTLEEAKRQLNIIGSQDDNLISTFIVAAARLCENETWRSFMPSSFTMMVSQALVKKDQLVYVSKAPVTAISNVKYYDSNETLQTMVNGTDYVYSLESEPAMVKFLTVPNVSTKKIYPYQIEFTGGWEAIEDVPTDIKIAVLMAVSDMYEMRNNSVVGVSLDTQLPITSKRLLAPYRINTY